MLKRTIDSKINAFTPKISQKIILPPNTSEFKDVVNHFNLDSYSVIQQLSTKKNDLKMLQQDAKKIHDFLTPTLVLSRDKNGVIDEKSGTEAAQEFDQSPPEAFFIFGNNDLNQVEEMAVIYHRLKKTGKAPSKIYISGYGGHGTSPGPIFAKTEAETMGRYLLELGIPQDIIALEKTAKNSGQNITLVDQLMNNENTLHRHILISGTPTGLLRQIRTYEQQSKYPWHRISTLPKNWDNLQKKYYSNLADGYINIFAALREIGSIIDYTINTSFLSPRTFSDSSVLTDAFQVYIKYLDMLTLQVTSTKEARDFIETFLKFTEEKAKNPDYKNIDFGMNAKKGADYFRKIFMFVERETMKYLADQKNPPQTVGEQSACLKDMGRRMAAYGLDAVRKM